MCEFLSNAQNFVPIGVDVLNCRIRVRNYYSDDVCAFKDCGSTVALL